MQGCVCVEYECTVCVCITMMRSFLGVQACENVVYDTLCTVQTGRVCPGLTYGVQISVGCACFAVLVGIGECLRVVHSNQLLDMIDCKGCQQLFNCHYCFCRPLVVTSCCCCSYYYCAMAYTIVH